MNNLEWLQRMAADDPDRLHEWFNTEREDEGKVAELCEQLRRQREVIRSQAQTIERILGDG